MFEKLALSSLRIRYMFLLVRSSVHLDNFVHIRTQINPLVSTTRLLNYSQDTNATGSISGPTRAL